MVAVCKDREAKLNCPIGAKEISPRLVRWPRAPTPGLESFGKRRKEFAVGKGPQGLSERARTNQNLPQNIPFPIGWEKVAAGRMRVGASSQMRPPVLTGHVLGGKFCAWQRPLKCRKISRWRCGKRCAFRIASWPNRCSPRPDAAISRAKASPRSAKSKPISVVSGRARHSVRAAARSGLRALPKPGYKPPAPANSPCARLWTSAASATNSPRSASITATPSSRLAGR